MTEERTKPEFDAPSGPAPSELVIRDIIVGDGAEAKPGDTVTVHYAGVGTTPARVRLVVGSWRVDPVPAARPHPNCRMASRYEGRRPSQWIIRHLAYGSAGGHFLGGKTLIFIIDLLDVG